METKHIPLHLLQCNEGQMEGLPTNPRYITDVMLRRLEKSLEESPEMLELRELIVMPYGEQYIVIGGNMRLRAAQAIGMHSLPCKVLPADTPVEKLKEYTIKDNGDFGAYDFDILANEWDDMPLIDWGVQMPHIGEQEERATEQTTEVQEDDECNPDDYGDTFTLNDGEKAPFQQMTFTLADEQARVVKEAIEKAKEQTTGETFGNTNTNGNALYNIVRQWADVKK